MWIKTALVGLLLTGIAFADDRADYDALKNQISEQRRSLNRFDRDKDYTNAMKTQKELAESAKEALKIALDSPDIDDAEAWMYNVNVLKDAGYYEESLKALDQYFKTPLLKRSRHREGWTKRAWIYKRLEESDKAELAYAKALGYAETPRERFHIYREQANLLLQEGEAKKALPKVEAAQELVPQIEEERRLNAERDLQSLWVRTYKALGQADQARQAKQRELELRQLLLNQEIKRFEDEYPKAGS